MTGSRHAATALAVVLLTSLDYAAVAAEPPAAEATLSCVSGEGGARATCAADTSAGVALRKQTGSAPCLLGKNWGYTDQEIWVSDGCGGDFYAQPPPSKKPEPAPDYILNRGFRLYEGEYGEMYLRLYTYVRYLNQLALDSTYTNAFGTTFELQKRQDIQLNKVFFPFSGWFLSQRFTYYLYVWTSNPSMGQPAQVVGAGNINYRFASWLMLGLGIGCLPTTRSTEGQFPFWLGVDDRMTSDEFFRGSYTEGVWLKGEFAPGLNYHAMLATSLSILGVSAAQLDGQINTFSLALSWLPTTKEFGPFGTFGDFDHHEHLATRLGAHFTQSREDKQSQPNTESIENTQIRLTDWSNIFTPDLFAVGTTVNRVTYQMGSVDAAAKWKGFSLEAEYFVRRLSDFSGAQTDVIAPIVDQGFQAQSSGMLWPKTVQVYFSGAGIFGRYGDSWELRGGLNWFLFHRRGVRFNAEWIYVYKSPVGYTAVPYPVGGTGNIFATNVELSF